MKNRIRTIALAMLGVGAALYFFANFQRVGIPGTIFDELQSSLGLSAAGVSLFGSVFMYPYAFCQLLVGMWIAKYGGKRTIAWGGLFFAAGAIMFPAANSVWVMYLARLLTGIGASTIYLAIIDEGARLFPDRVAQISGFLIMAGYMGGVCACTPFRALTAEFGWRPVMAVAGGVTAALAIMYDLAYFRVRGEELRNYKNSVNTFRLGSYVKLLGRMHNWEVWGAHSLNFAIFYTFVTVLGKKFLQDVGGISSAPAANIFSTVVALSALGSVVMGILGSHFGKPRRIFYVVSAGMTVAGLMFAMFTGGRYGLNPWWATSAFLGMAFFGSISAVAVAQLRELNHGGDGALAVGLSNFIAYILVAALGNGAGLLLDCFTPTSGEGGVLIYPASAYRTIFAGLSMCAVLVNFCAWRLPRRKE